MVAQILERLQQAHGGKLALAAPDRGGQGVQQD